MLSSSVLVLIIPSHKSNKSILTGKLFEYLGSEKPILCLGPEDGDAAEILNAAGAGKTIGYNNVDSISYYLLQIPENQTHSEENQIIKYSRRELTKRLSEILLSEI